MQAGFGTHMDSPAHCFQQGKSVDKVPMEELISPCVCIDVSHLSHERFLLEPDHLFAFEGNYGKVPKGGLVVVRTGWDIHWPDADTYRNNHVFPSVAPEVAEILIERGVSGIGIDTLSPDTKESGFPVHRLILGEGKIIVENIANSHLLPPVGAFSMVMPMKAAGLTESPVRMIGLVPK